MGFITRDRAALQSTHPTQNVKLIIRYYLNWGAGFSLHYSLFMQAKASAPSLYNIINYLGCEVLVENREVVSCTFLRILDDCGMKSALQNMI